MKFYPLHQGDSVAANCATLFEGHTVLLPAVSFANLGQLALDLLTNTLLQKGKDLGLELTHVGHLLSENVPPIAGGAAFGNQPREKLCLNLEVYQIASKKITIVQQRSAAFQGRVGAFAKELVEWAKESKIASFCVVAGTDNMLRHDPNMLSCFFVFLALSLAIRAIHSNDFAQQNHGLLARVKTIAATVDIESGKAQWESIRGAGIAPLLHAQCEERQLPFLALVMACAEGNNVPDAAAMVFQLAIYLELSAPVKSPASSLPLVLPPSWSQLFGREPDVSLYL